MGFLPLIFALVGHGFLWIGLVNRLHALGISHKIIKAGTLGGFACMAALPLLVVWQWFSRAGELAAPLSVYAAVCWAIATITLVRLAWIRFADRRPALLRSEKRRRAALDMNSAAKEPAELHHHWLARLPKNEILQLDVTERTVALPRLPTALDGLKIVHLSDVHFTGYVGKAYFREVVRIANELQPDLVCLTGDLLDRARCFDWIADTLGRLSARHGAYFILGNHDHRIDFDRLRRTLVENGLTDLGGRWLQIAVNGVPIILGGNERPCFGAAPDETLRVLPETFRIVLAHTPDQLGWARRQNADLMLAGHTHGGQICIPPLGAIFSPTYRGVRHISGVYYVRPTVLQVSRGLSGDIPVRWNCPPEIVLLRLQAPVD